MTTEPVLPPQLHDRSPLAMASSGVKLAASSAKTCCQTARTAPSPVRRTPSGAGPVDSKTMSGVHRARAASTSWAANATPNP